LKIFFLVLNKIHKLCALCFDRNLNASVLARQTELSGDGEGEGGKLSILSAAAVVGGACEQISGTKITKSTK